VEAAAGQRAFDSAADYTGVSEKKNGY